MPRALKQRALILYFHKNNRIIHTDALAQVHQLSGCANTRRTSLRASCLVHCRPQIAQAPAGALCIMSCAVRPRQTVRFLLSSLLGSAFAGLSTTRVKTSGWCCSGARREGAPEQFSSGTECESVRAFMCCCLQGAAACSSDGGIPLVRLPRSRICSYGSPRSKHSCSGQL